MSCHGTVNSAEAL